MLAKNLKFAVQRVTFKWIGLVLIACLLSSCTTTYSLINRYVPVEKPPAVIPPQQVFLKKEFSPGGCYGNTVFYRERGEVYWLQTVPRGYTEYGIASWYGKKFHGRKAANNEIYNMYALTAAHKTLPLDAMVRVVNLNNGKSILVRITDRGPFLKGRIIDLSYAAAKKIAMVKSGLAEVKIIVEQVNYNNSLEGPPDLFTANKLPSLK